MQKKTITKLLDLPNFEVAEVLDYHDDSLHLYIDLVDPVGPVCSACGDVHHLPAHSVGWIRVEDLPLCGKRTFLYVPKRKVRCPVDGRIRVEQLDQLRGRFTRRFAAQVYRLTSITTNAEAGWFLNLDDEVVYRIDRSMLEELAREKLSPVPAPAHISVDEVAWQKWHKYVTNVIDIDQRKVIWNHDGRGKQTMDAFFTALGEEKSAAVEAAACDGARGYLSSIRQHAKLLEETLQGLGGRKGSRIRKGVRYDQDRLCGIEQSTFKPENIGTSDRKASGRYAGKGRRIKMAGKMDGVLLDEAETVQTPDGTFTLGSTGIDSRISLHAFF